MQTGMERVSESPTVDECDQDQGLLPETLPGCDALSACLGKSCTGGRAPMLAFFDPRETKHCGSVFEP